MSDRHIKYLLVGGGLAASSAATAIRQLDHEGDLMMVGQEISRPYHRPPLSKEYLRGLLTRESLFTTSAEWFVQNHVELRTGRRVSRLDTTRNAVILDNGEGLSFDRLLIATGGGAAPLDIPGAQLPNLFYLRTLEDAELLQHATAKAAKVGQPHDKGRGSAVVIGGGPLGIELAASLSQAGMRVDLALSAEHPLRRYAGETTGRFISRYLESKGVTVHRNDRAAKLDGDGRIQKVVLASGKILPCDFAVAAVGIAIQKELLRGTPIAAEQAILVDSSARTNVPAIYAAGDCAAIFDPLFGRHRMMHHWDSAAKIGTIAGTNMAGGSAIFNTASYFDTKVFDLEIGVWGDARSVDHRILRGPTTIDSPSFIEFGVSADGRAVQIIAVGNATQKATFASLIERRASLAGKEEQLKEPSQSLESILESGN